MDRFGRREGRLAAILFKALVNGGNVLNFRADEACGWIGFAGISADFRFLCVVLTVVILFFPVITHSNFIDIEDREGIGWR